MLVSSNTSTGAAAVSTPRSSSSLKIAEPLVRLDGAPYNWKASRRTASSAAMDQSQVAFCDLRDLPSVANPHLHGARTGARGRATASDVEARLAAFKVSAARDLPETYLGRFSASDNFSKLLIRWRSLRDSNPCYSLERAMSWASRRRERDRGPEARARYYREPPGLLKTKAQELEPPRRVRRDARRHSPHHPAVPARDFPLPYLAQRVARAQPPARWRFHGVSRGRQRARPVAGARAEGLRRRDRRAAGGGEAAVPQLPAGGPQIPSRARVFRPRHHRGGHVSGHQCALAGG